MRQDFRQFSVVDPFGRSWDVDLRWIQNAISIRHADAVDCKYYISHGEEKMERVIALPHAGLGAAARRHDREISDAWCIRIAGLHLEHMLSTWEDMDKTIVTVPQADLDRHASTLAEAAAELLRKAALTR
ncbi:MAG TPA: hypothetical protein DCY80_19730 [Solibacterales bacterium]|nr:hypothetical protein [Bryobacterales bacterium]